MVAPAKAPPKKAVAKKVAPAPKKMTGNIVVDAERLLQEHGISLGHVVGQLFPLERDDTVRTPKRTSLKNVQSQPVAVLMVEWDSDSKEKDDDLGINDPLDRDVEGFDDLDDGKAYYDVNVAFAQSDVKEFNDARHLVVIFPDTGDLMDYTYDIITPKTDEGKAFNEKLKTMLDGQDISFMFYGDVNKDQIKAPKAVNTGPKVAGRKLRDPNAPAAKQAAKKAPAKKIASKGKPEPKPKVDGEDLARRLEASREKRGVDRHGRLVQQAADVAINGDVQPKIKPKAKARPVTVVDDQKDVGAQAAAFAGRKRPAKKAAAPKVNRQEVPAALVDAIQKGARVTVNSGGTEVTV